MAERIYSECKDLFAALSQYLDRDLPAGDCAEIEQHIADCPPCIEFVNSLRQTVGLCRTCNPAATLPMPDEVRSKLLAAYQQSIQGK